MHKFNSFTCNFKSCIYILCFSWFYDGPPNWTALLRSLARLSCQYKMKEKFHVSYSHIFRWGLPNLFYFQENESLKRRPVWEIYFITFVLASEFNNIFQYYFELQLQVSFIMKYPATDDLIKKCERDLLKYYSAYKIIMRFTKKYGGNIWYNICLFTFMSPLFSYMYVYLDEYIFHKNHI